jgi:succinate-semialdehyde dehydrogenase/glutarate-semialdehyde dehydrogenase
MILKSINPFTNEIIGEFPEYSESQTEELMHEAADSSAAWKKTSFSERMALMVKVSELLRDNVEKYAGIITSEMGKPIKESKAEVEKCAWVCEYYAENAEDFLKKEIIRTDADLSYVSYEPLGTILGIMPWNFPFWQVFRFAVPTLMAGNSILLKHASNVQISARLIETIFKEAGFPENLFTNLVLGSGRMEKIIGSDLVKAVSLTGSEFAGEKVAETAGRNLKKMVLELGGSNAFLVFGDADIEKAAETGISARFQNAGQSCIAAKRFILVKKISDRFVREILDRVRKLKTGNPFNPDTDIGPLANISQAEKVEKQVRDSVSMGAELIAGGAREKALFEPSVVINVRPGMPLFDEEVFGPVAPIIIAEDRQDAIALANRSVFGLGVSVFTEDQARYEELAREFHDGAVFINGLVKSDPRLPFGGTGRSGFGRELAAHGIREFVNVKSVWVRRLV